ncbi:MAG: hypothetical protein ACREQ9_06710 [Candidatus Binatia bacterium]
MSSLFSILTERWRAFWRELESDAEREGFLPLLRPVAPYDGPIFQNPLTTLGIVLALLATSGIAMAALGVLLVALLALYFLLTEVLGISIEVRPFPA